MGRHGDLPLHVFVTRQNMTVRVIVIFIAVLCNINFSSYPRSSKLNPIMNDMEGKWEQRWHPLWREWVVYAAHRNQRPWNFDSALAQPHAPAYDPDCYLCPGNPRVHGHRNPDYQDVFIFDNDHPVTGQNAPVIPPEWECSANGLYRRSRAQGVSRVVCYDPRHNVTLSQVSVDRIAKVFEAWRDQTSALKEAPGVEFVLIFENKGEAVGVSNPHPHCQIYATNFVFRIVALELESAREYRREKNRSLFEDVIEAEREEEIRLIAQNEHAVAFVPFFARYAYEIHIFPTRRHSTLITMSDEELFGMTQVFQQVVRRYDLLFNVSFPYVLSVLQAPLGEGDFSDYHLHFFVQPPWRQPGLQKFLAGPEIGGGNFMADTMPEAKAAELRQVDLSQFPEVD